MVPQNILEAFMELTLRVQGGFALAALGQARDN